MADLTTPEAAAFDEKLRRAAMPDEVRREFLGRYGRFRAGDDGTISWDEIAMPGTEDIVDLETLGPVSDEEASRLVGALVSIKLNGGLGTTMKLEGPKSLLAVRDGRSFLALIAEQIARLRRRHGVDTLLLLMNSYRTRDASLAELKAVGFSQEDLPWDFLQHKVPRIDRDTFLPLRLDVSADVSEEWTPPGHGDLYRALHLSGILDRLLDRGVKWAFVSNVDNLGATVDLRIPAYLDAAGLDFLMEVTPKTPADIKGGVLARWRGRLALIERGQVSKEAFDAFEDTSRFADFNTNSLWWRVEAMRDAVAADRLALPTIVNPKTVQGCRVVQLETAMGAAIGSFSQAKGLRVSRQRFAPVKGTSDLLVVRSDAYALDEEGGLRPNPVRGPGLVPPIVTLDPRFYQSVADLDARVMSPPSLVACRSLRVDGDVTFGRDVEIRGDVRIATPEGGAHRIADGTLLEDTSLAL
ncbi:MAG: UTP--glucose-1-phosphate uridylyltransferase [Deltaproteobacteria bacterium]|nr:UTP--glucose-1-phosphate uridylyltransferase [Deltaproteobacteria bacterium]